MKKKFFLFLILPFFLCGCTKINNGSYDMLIAEAMNSNGKAVNTYRAGYKFYLPKGVKIIHHEGSNEILGVEDDIYYLYVDRVSYFNRIKEKYEEKTDVYYSRALEKDNLFGYLEIKITENNKYFVEIMYNYAKIEVIVEKEDIQKAISYSMVLLSSIYYQDEVLTSLMGDDVLQANEVEHNIFESADTESGYLQIVEQYGQYEEKDEVMDPDFIR